MPVPTASTAANVRSAPAPATKAKPRREPVEVVEPRRPDRTLAQMQGIRQQRLQRVEAEAVAARRACADAARAVREAIAATRALDAQTRDYWRDTVQSFLSRTIDSQELMRARAEYRRRCDQAAAQRGQARQQVRRWRQTREARRVAQDLHRQAQRAVEKLSMWQEMQRESLPAAD